MDATFRLRFLGPVQVERDGQPVLDFRSRKALALLGYLAVQDRPLPREHLVDLFWEDRAETPGRANLSWVLSRITTRLPGCLQADRHTVQFQRSASCWLDLDAFDELEAQGDISSLTDAVELVRGDFLEGMFLDGCAEFELWLVGERERWRQRAARVLEELVARHSQRGEREGSLHFANRLLALDPLHEPAHRHLMQLYAQAGRRTAALRQYRACMRVLEEELGLPPSAETTALYERIRSERARPTEPEVAAPAAPSPTAPHLPAFLSEEEAPRAVERPVFVARERELAQLDRYLEAALAGHGQVVLVTGGPGRGKTALMREFARQAMEAHPNLLVAVGNCNAHSGVGDPYLPFREVLGMLTGDVEARWAAGTVSRDHARQLWAAFPLAVQALVDYGPSLIPTILSDPTLLSRATAVAPEGAAWLSELRALSAQERAGPGDLEQSAIFHQFTNVLRTLAETRPLLLMLDDLQWTDSTSVGLLFHLGRRLEGGRILIACAYRPEEVALGREGERHPLEKVLAEFRRSFGDVCVDLRRADEREGRRFVDVFLDTEPNRLGQGFRRAMFAHTGGHPLFTVEVLRAMRERSDLALDAEGRWVEGPSLDWGRLPARVEAAIAERIGRLDEDLRDVLAVASVEGERFTAQVVARVQDIPEREVLRALSQELGARHRLVREGEEIRIDGRFLSRYQFGHALFQEYLYGGLSGGERRLLHGEIAAALEELYGDQTAEIVAHLAHHYAEAGQTEKAIEYLNEAGDRARGLYAHQEAIGAYERALALLKEQGDNERAARTLMKLGLTYDSAFDFRRGREAYQTGFALWQWATTAGPAAALPPAPHALRLFWGQPRRLDPLVGGALAGQFYSGLVDHTPDLGIVPDVAASWEVLDGGRRYVFHLREDVAWSDGVPVTAGDFQCAWQCVLDPATRWQDASLLYDIRGARAFHEGRGHDLGVRALDDTTLSVELEGPVGYLLHLLACWVAYPVPRHVVEGRGSSWADPEGLVTNGPFTLASWRPGESMVLERYLQYHKLAAGNLDRVELTFFQAGQPSAPVEMYQAGLSDVIQFPAQQSIETMNRLRRLHAAEWISLPSLNTGSLVFDTARPPFDDPRVRRAFAHALDRERLVDVVWGGFWQTATGGFVPPGMPGHSPGIALAYDPEHARELLAEAGYPGGVGFPAVEVLWAGPPEPEAWEPLVGQWNNNLNLDVTIHYDPGSAEYAAKVDKAPPYIYFAAWLADYPDPDNYLRVAVQSLSAWHHEGYLEVVERARRTLDHAERMKLYAQAERILAEEVPILPVDYDRKYFLVKPWVRRYPRSAHGRLFWKDVVIEGH